MQELFDRFDKNKAFSHLEFMERIGPRAPGTDIHKKLENYIKEIGSLTKASFFEQKYSFEFLGKNIEFNNLIYIFKGNDTPPRKKLLLGTHYDSRVIADNEKDPALRISPIPGINDGGSGTAVFLELLKIFNDVCPPKDIALVFFDAEDVGNIEGKSFSEGAEYFAANFNDYKPDEVIIIDMIGGIDACYNVDFGAFDNPKSHELLSKLWTIGINLNLKPFTSNKNFTGSWFICDHTPFAKRGIPACLLIDITYKWWHTQEDACKHCSPDSLEAIAKVLLAYINNNFISS